MDTSDHESVPESGEAPNGLIAETTAVVEIERLDGGVQPVNLDITWQDLGLPENIINGVYEAGFERPSKIQAAALPLTSSFKSSTNWSLAGREQNLIAQAQNGSGKTGAFALAVLSRIDISLDSTQAIILAPTRELVLQIASVIDKLGKYLNDAKLCFCAVPGQDRYDLKNKDSKVTEKVVVGSTGKTLEFFQKRALNGSNIKVFVLDEADVMLDQENAMGPQVNTIRKFLPPKNKLQILLFSATFPENVAKFATKIVPDANKILVKKENMRVDSITQLKKFVDSDDEKYSVLDDMFVAMNVSQSIIFVNTRKTAFALAKRLKSDNHSVSLITGGTADGTRIDPKKRDEVMEEFRKGVTKVLVATDVLARGIDVPQVTLVVNYQIPRFYDGTKERINRERADVETFLHRCGRTGRFGKRGYCVNLFTSKEEGLIKQISEEFGIAMHELPPVDELESKIKELPICSMQIKN